MESFEPSPVVEVEEVKGGNTNRDRAQVIDDSLNVEDEVKRKEQLTIEIIDDKQGEIATDRNISGDESLDVV